MRIVLIEDNAMLARGVIQALETRDMRWTGSPAAMRGAQFIRPCRAAIWPSSTSTLPGRSGIAVLRDMRARGEGAPVILTHRSHGAGRPGYGVFDSGADDYLTKPFEMAELAARGQGAVAPPHRAGGRARTDRLPAIRPDGAAA